MMSAEISLDGPAANAAWVTTRPGRPVLIAMILGLLTAASILLLIYQENRALHYGIEATEGWSAYQVKIVQTTVEEDPNLKEQYTEEQDLLRAHAQELKQTSSNARSAVLFCSYAALLLLFGSAIAVIALVAKSTYTPYAAYAGLLLGLVGIGLGIRALF
jgi:hypothetical protein